MCNVNIATGEVSQFEVDASFPGRIPWNLIRTYSSSAREPSLVGYGWRLNLGTELRLRGDQLSVVLEGAPAFAVPLPVAGAEIRHAESGRTIRRTDSTLEIIEPDQIRFVFPSRAAGAGPMRVIRKADVWGNAIEYEHDETGRLRLLVDSAGRRFFWDYDRAGRLSEVSWCPDPARRARTAVARYEFDDHEDLVAVWDPNGRAVRYEYEGHLLVRVVDRVGEEACYQYDDRGRCVHTWRSGGLLRRRLSFDDRRRRVLVADSSGHQTLYTNNAAGTTIAEVDALGRERADLVDDQGNVLLNTSRTGAIREFTVRDEAQRTLVVSRNGAETQYGLDEQSRPLSRLTPDGALTRFAYDRGGNLVCLISPSGAEWRFEYDAHGDLIRARDPRGRLLYKDRPTGNRLILRDERGVLQDTQFDAWGRAVELRDGAGNRMRIEYDACGNPVRILSPDQTERHFSYDGMGNLTQIVDELGRVTRFDLAVDGTCIDARLAGGSTEVQRFDLEGRLVQLVNAKGETASFEYDVAGRCVAINYFDGHREEIQYDATDNPVAVVDGATRRVLAEMEFDGGKLVRESLPDGSEVVVDYGPLGEVVLLQNRHAALMYQRDQEARIVQEQTGNATLRFTYDAMGNRTSLVASHGRRIEYGWDSRSRLTTMTDSARWTYEYVHNELDLVIELRMPNGLTQFFEYDALHRMTARRVVRADGATVCSRDYEYDAAGRLIRYRDSLRGTRHFSYDEQDNLLTVSDGQQTLESYRYDLNGNLLENRTGELIRYAAGDRAIACGADQLEYDTEANLIRRRTPRGDFVYEYDGENRLAALRTPDGRTAEFTYDPLARRLSKCLGKTRTEFVWDGLAPLCEISGGKRRDFLFLPGSFFLAGMTCDDQHYSFVFDQLGTPTELLDERGDIVWSVDYSAYGEIVGTRTGAVPQPFRFQGQYCDDELGLHYNRYRYFDPRLGRFTCSDPLGFAAGSNLYAYVPNPVNWADPLGLETCEITPKCNWSKKQQADAKKKAAASNAKIKELGGGKGVSIPAPCDHRKNAKDIYDKCRKDGSPLAKLKESSSKCSNEQADHILEVCAGGAEDGAAGCENLQPLNESVNKSFGSQMGNCAAALRAAGKKLTKVKLLDMSQCRPGGTKCPDR